METTNQMTFQAAKRKLGSLLTASLVVQVAFSTGLTLALAQGPATMPAAPPSSSVVAPMRGNRATVRKSRTSKVHQYPGSMKVHGHKAGRKAKNKKAKGPLPKPPQELVGQLSQRTVAPGVVHKVHRGSMFINVLDVDLANASVLVKPVLAGESFNKLDEVRDQAQKVRALAAVNGNYFKKDGTPLGTLIIDGEWISGPLYDRTCMGLTRDGRVLFDRVALHGDLVTSNPEVPRIWVNNTNQPRRHGCRLIAYTRRWGSTVKMQYEGTLVAVDYMGNVIGKALQEIAIPAGGYVLSDSKESDINKLNVGDVLNLTWSTNPAGWSDVINAVSGGPVLIRNGQLYVGFKDERFGKAWTGSHIHARTAIGVTANKHLLLATIEGPHTLYDVAKFLKKLGAIDAMNLDGGGSTTMVIGSQSVTRNKNKKERRVASSLAILPRAASETVTIYRGDTKEDVTVGGSSQPAPRVPQNTLVPLSEAGQDNPDVLAGEPSYNSGMPEPVVQPKAEKQGHFKWIKKLNPLK